MSSDEARIALITGTNRGTGRAIAEDLRSRGYRVFSLNRSLTGEEWLGERRCDLADPGQIRKVVGQVLDEVGRLDVCVSNAVDRVFDSIAELSEADWERLVSINLSAGFHLVKAVLPALRASRGVFVMMGSHAGTRYFEGGAAYSATKAGLKALVETLLLEERRNGVRACLVSPGAISNLDGDESTHKVSTRSVAHCVGDIVDSWPRDLVVGEVEVRPANLAEHPITGIDRLLHV